MLIAARVDNFMFSSEVSLGALCHSTYVTDFLLHLFDCVFGPCSKLGQNFHSWQAELVQLGLLGNSKCETADNCPSSLETT